jgi:hypothetical protein
LVKRNAGIANPTVESAHPDRRPDHSGHGLAHRAGRAVRRSSSIVLTTITDIAGFFSFLGIATGFMGLL